MTTSRARRRAALTALAAGALLLTGCVHSPIDDVLESGTAVELPNSLAEEQSGLVELDTARLLGEDSEGRRFHVARGGDTYGATNTICLIVDGLATGPMTGCGALPLEIASDEVRVVLTYDPDLGVDDDDAERVGEYVVVFD